MRFVALHRIQRTARISISIVSGFAGSSVAPLLVCQVALRCYEENGARGPQIPELQTNTARQAPCELPQIYPFPARSPVPSFSIRNIPRC